MTVPASAVGVPGIVMANQVRPPNCVTVPTKPLPVASVTVTVSPVVKPTGDPGRADRRGHAVSVHGHVRPGRCRRRSKLSRLNCAAGIINACHLVTNVMKTPVSIEIGEHDATANLDTAKLVNDRAKIKIWIAPERAWRRLLLLP